MIINDSYLMSFYNAVLTDLAGGYIRIYDGSMPASPESPLSGQQLLAELRIPTPAGEYQSGNGIVFGAIVADASANITGTAVWARLLKANGTTGVIDITVGPSGELQGQQSIVAGKIVTIDSLYLKVENV
jgi:hypothetical protein